jgi:PleD family two-component response regulator
MQNKKALIADSSHNCSILAKNWLKTLWVDKENIVVLQNWNDVLERATKEIFDIILLSPYRLWLDHIELAHQIKNHSAWKNTKIVEYTSGIANHKKNNVFDQVIFKPTTKEEFSEKILQLFQSPEEK